ncbi:hypothetical protein L484_017923 [Morus notabilis]|uniref:Uncharacterized protein n=1 Tax=Morus notabilis TaxID=981085 RepID=W9R9B1_9ROSA|nr:hypothetical protein L484_017923 [Morus notabilis]
MSFDRDSEAATVTLSGDGDGKFLLLSLPPSQKACHRLVVFSDDSKRAKIRVVTEIHNSEIYLSEGRTPQLSSISEALLFDQIRQLCARRVKLLSGAA